MILLRQGCHLPRNSVYVSSNVGVTFAKTATLGTSTAVNQIRVHPTIAGDVWVSTDVGLFHSTNFGSTFTQVGSGVTAGWSFGKTSHICYLFTLLTFKLHSSRSRRHHIRLPNNLRLFHYLRHNRSLQDRRRRSQLGHDQRCRPRVRRRIRKRCWC